MRALETRLPALLLLPLLGLASAVGFAGCEPRPSEPGSALINVRSQALAAADVDHVTVTISGAGINPDIVATLAGDPRAGWSGVVEKIPAGSERRFAVQALDSGDNVLYAGDATNVTIDAGKQTFLVIFLQPVVPPGPFENAAPRFRALNVSSLDVVPGGTVQLAAEAFDPDPGDVLAYAWTAPVGQFQDPISAVTTWTAPDKDGSYELTISVRDPKMATASLSVFIKVFTPSGSAQIDVSLNRWPQIAGLVPEPARIDVGESTFLRLDVSDPDGDRLLTTWTADCAGSFDNATLAQPTFTLGAGAGNDGCKLSVEISDGRGGHNTASIRIATGPPVDPTVGTGGTSGSGGSGGSGGTGGSPGGGTGAISCWFSNADSTPAAFVASGMIYGADGVPLGRIQSSIAYYADGSVAGRLVGGTIYSADGSVRAFRRGDLLYSADGTLLARGTSTIYRADGTVAGQTGCQDPVTTVALTLFGVFAL
jgi:hypothetical protein